ncbi:MAG: hypothetical protein CL862_03980 [Cyanobium sp. NAT70]|nr:hypothetical protein [Cyanobium sp. NAT70]
MDKPLTDAVLRRLATAGLTNYLRDAEGFQTVMRPGCDLILSQEPVADMTCVVVGPGAADQGNLADALQACRNNALPFFAILISASGGLAPSIASSAGLSHAIDDPFMVHDDEPKAKGGH